MSAPAPTFWSPTPPPPPKPVFDAAHPASTRRAHGLLHAGAQVTALPGLPPSTKERYATWTLRYMRFLLRLDLGDPRPAYLQRFLRHLAVNENASAPQRRDAAEALTFFHEVVLDQTIERTAEQVDLLTEREQHQIVECMNGPLRLLAVFVFATGLSVDDALRLRVGDVDLDERALVVRDDEGRALDRMTLPDLLVTPLRNHLAWVRSLHGGEVSDGRTAAPVPASVRHRFPGADRAFAWQFLFPASEATPSDDATQVPIRGVMDASPLRRALDSYAGTKTRCLHVTRAA